MSVTATMTVELQLPVELEKRASAVLKREGLTLDEAVMQMLTKTADSGMWLLAEPYSHEGGDEAKEPGYDEWVVAELEEAMSDMSPGIPHEVVKEDWKKQRAELARLAVEHAA